MLLPLPMDRRQRFTELQAIVQLHVEIEIALLHALAQCLSFDPLHDNIVFIPLFEIIENLGQPVRSESHEWKESSAMASLLPNNPMMLLSVVNTQLRDEFESLDELCAFFNADRDDIEEKLSAIDYAYDPDLNRFV